MATNEEIRAHIRVAIEEAMRMLEPGEPAEAPDAMLLGWVLVAEWRHPDGSPMLTGASGDTINQPLPPWRASGLLFDRLHARSDEPA